jgi:uncharacterized membrane protein YfcA
VHFYDGRRGVDERRKDLGFAPLAVVGVVFGMHLFTAVDHARLRHLVFALLFVLGLTLCLRG